MGSNDRALRDILAEIRPISRETESAAQTRLDQLTKPPGSLGRLETLAKSLAAVTRSTDMQFRRKMIFTFAGDHGIAQEGVSAYPQSVTAQMVLNFLRGGAAVNVLAREAGAQVCVIDAGTVTPVDDPTLVSRRIGPGTRNFYVEDAMTRDEATRAIEAGAGVFLDEDDHRPVDLAGVGDMGIGNTTAAAALFCVLLGKPPDVFAGRGTGLDDDGLRRKIDILEKSLAKRRADPSDAVDALSKVGGFEIGEMAGCFLAGAARRRPMIVDGFISTAAALIAIRLCPAVQDYMFFSHCSAERGHALALREIGAQPILNFDMRLGEGTGSALAMPVLSAAAAILRDMATFASAGVDGKNSSGTP